MTESKTPDTAQLLARNQPCGCIICYCDNIDQCQGCGAKCCGNHAVGEIPDPIFETWHRPQPDTGSAITVKPLMWVEHDRYLEGWGVPDNCIVRFQGGNITTYSTDPRAIAISEYPFSSIQVTPAPTTDTRAEALQEAAALLQMQLVELQLFVSNYSNVMEDNGIECFGYGDLLQAMSAIRALIDTPPPAPTPTVAEAAKVLAVAKIVHKSVQIATGTKSADAFAWVDDPKPFARAFAQDDAMVCADLILRALSEQQNTSATTTHK